MNNVQKSIEALKEAEKFLDEHITDPKNYNDHMSTALEIISWDIGRKISELQERLSA